LGEWICTKGRRVAPIIHERVAWFVLLEIPPFLLQLPVLSIVTSYLYLDPRWISPPSPPVCFNFFGSRIILLYPSRSRHTLHFLVMLSTTPHDLSLFPVPPLTLPCSVVDIPCCNLYYHPCHYPSVRVVYDFLRLSPLSFPPFTSCLDRLFCLPSSLMTTMCRGRRHLTIPCSTTSFVACMSIMTTICSTLALSPDVAVVH